MSLEWPLNTQCPECGRLRVGAFDGKNCLCPLSVTHPELSPDERAMIILGESLADHAERRRKFFARQG